MLSSSTKIDHPRGPLWRLRWHQLLRAAVGLVVVNLWAGVVAAAPLLGQPGKYPVDGAPVGIVATEVDLQNGVDLVTANEAGEDGPSLSFLLNQGDGSFAPEQRLNLDAGRYILHAIAAGDFNGDGAGDIAVAVDDISVFPIRATVLVYRSDGTGQYLAPDVYPLTGLFPQCLAAGDVNGDGILDLVVCDSTVETGDGMLLVLTGRETDGAANGSFTMAGSFDVGTSPTTVAIGDADGDGHADVLVGDPDERAVYILYGTGTESLLGAPVALAQVDSPSGLAVLQDKPLPQLVVTSLAHSDIEIFGQPMARTFVPLAPIAVDQPPSSMAVADFNDDGLPDLALVSLPTAQMEVWLGQPGGGFALSQNVPVDEIASAVATGDFNDDGIPDVGVTSLAADRVTVFLKGEDAPVSPTPTPSPTRTPSVTPTPTPTPTPSPTVATPPHTLTPTQNGLATRTPTGPTKTATLSATPTHTMPPSGPGDANCDGHIDALDLAALIDRMFQPGCQGADVDGDGQVNVRDLLLLLQSLQGGGR